MSNALKPLQGSKTSQEIPRAQSEVNSQEDGPNSYHARADLPLPDLFLRLGSFVRGQSVHHGGYRDLHCALCGADEVLERSEPGWTSLHAAQRKLTYLFEYHEQKFCQHEGSARLRIKSLRPSRP